jgi:hypothetical protein
MKIPMAKEQGFESDEFIEPQIADYDPLMEPVKERSYTKPNVEGGAILEDLQEPSFAPPSFDDLDAGDAGPQPNAEPASANPYMNDLSGKEKKMASEQLVDAVLTGYEGLHKIANQMVRINPDEINELIATGEIDRNLELPLPDGNTMSVPEFVDSFNEQAGEAISLDPEFKEKVRPPMIRVFEKRGIGMTDEQFLAYMFVTDAAPKLFQIVQLRRTTSKMKEMWRQMSVGTPPTPPQGKPQQTPPPAPKPPREPEYVVEEPVSFQQEFSEPEEMVRPTRSNSNSNFAAPAPSFEGEPTFGDPKILSNLEKLSSQGSKSKRGRPPKNK